MIYECVKCVRFFSNDNSIPFNLIQFNSILYVESGRFGSRGMFKSSVTSIKFEKNATQIFKLATGTMYVICRLPGNFNTRQFRSMVFKRNGRRQNDYT